MSAAKAQAVLAAAVAYGDASVAMHKALSTWKRGDDLSPLSQALRDADRVLQSAAKAYATATRKSRKAREVQP